MLVGEGTVQYRHTIALTQFDAIAHHTVGVRARDRAYVRCVARAHRIFSFRNRFCPPTPIITRHIHLSIHLSVHPSIQPQSRQHTYTNVSNMQTRTHADDTNERGDATRRADHTESPDHLGALVRTNVDSANDCTRLICLSSVSSLLCVVVVVRSLGNQ